MRWVLDSQHTDAWHSKGLDGQMVLLKEATITGKHADKSSQWNKKKLSLVSHTSWDVKREKWTANLGKQSLRYN